MKMILFVFERKSLLFFKERGIAGVQKKHGSILKLAFSKRKRQFRRYYRVSSGHLQGLILREVSNTALKTRCRQQRRTILQ